MTNEQIAKNTIDSLLGVGGLTSPWWLTMLEQGAQAITIIGAAILVMFRLYFAYLDWQERRAAKCCGAKDRTPRE